jgi:zinc transport system substrate-binding protein
MVTFRKTGMRAILTIRTWLLVVVPLAAACSTGPAPAAGGGEGDLHVVASFLPLAEAARRVGGDCVDVTDLTPQGVEPHDLELPPDALEAIATADLVVYLGAGFQPAVQAAVGEASGVVVDALRGQPELAPGDGSTIDPHVWLDPSRFSRIGRRIAGSLRAAGIPPTCPIDARAAAFRDELAVLDAEFATGLADCESDVIVTSHAAFGYLADAYGLRQEAISGLEPEAEPDARRLADLRDLVVRERVTTIFTEELVAPDVAETLAAEVGARTAVLSTIESASPAGDYASVMRQNLRRLRDALGCT